MTTSRKTSGLIVALFLGTAAILWAQNKTQTRTIQIREAQLRETPSFNSKVVGRLSYTDPVESIEETNSWLRVRATNSATGWLHSSAVSTKRIVLKSGDSNANTVASPEEVVIAGKGFNREVEDQYRRDEGLDFHWMDEMDRQTWDPAELEQFLKDGGLQTGGAL